MRDCNVVNFEFEWTRNVILNAEPQVPNALDGQKVLIPRFRVLKLLKHVVKGNANGFPLESASRENRRRPH